LRWLRSGLDTIIVNQLFKVARTPTYPNYGDRVLNLHPQIVWKVSSEQLALFLVADATRARLGRPFRRTRSAAVRANRRALQEMVACARVLPASGALVARWEQRLGAFNKQFPEAAV